MSLSTLPQSALPSQGLRPVTVKESVLTLLQLDSATSRNYGRQGFTTTTLDIHTQDLMTESCMKNLSNWEEYPALTNIHDCCVEMISRLWNAPAGRCIGCATTGSSEAIMLGGLAMKKAWEAKHKERTALQPNVIVGNHAHIAIDKFANACGVALRKVAISAESCFSFDTSELLKMVDAGTIGVILILGNTFTGHFDPIEKVSTLLDHYEARTGRSIPIHVDAASGGFVAPFLNVQDFKWDFSVSRVVSINASGHKFGLTAPAVGWLVWRDISCVPEDMHYNSVYLTGKTKSITQSFSQTGMHVIVQYYNFCTLGIEGYEGLVRRAMERAIKLANWLEGTGWFVCINNYVRAKPDPEYREPCHRVGIPMVAFSLTSTIRQQFPSISEAMLSGELKKIGYYVPACELPTFSSNQEVLRIVIRLTMGNNEIEDVVKQIFAIVHLHMSQAQGAKSEVSNSLTNSVMLSKRLGFA